MPALTCDIVSRSIQFPVVLLVAVLLALPASAREEGANSASLGVGDAVRSSGVGTTALYFNPAGMHQFLQYAVETGYQFIAPLEGHAFTASMVDSATNRALAAGISYTYITGNELLTDLSRSGHMIRGGLASGWHGKNLSVHAGAGIRYLSLDIDGGSATGFTMDVGALLVVNGMFRLGIVGHNLIETQLEETPRRMGIGTSLLYYSLLVSFDAIMDFESNAEQTEVEYNAGLEYAISGTIPLRVGYRHNEYLDQRYVTGGIGYVSKVVAVDFGFAQSVDKKDDNIFSLNVKAFIP